MLLQLQLLVGTRLGVRVEYVTAALLPRSTTATALAKGMAVLQPANGFECEEAGVRVVAWGAPACRVSEVSAARFRLPAPAAEREYDAGAASCTDADANDGAAVAQHRPRPPSTPQRRRRRRSGTLSLISPSSSSPKRALDAAVFFFKKKKRRRRPMLIAARIIKDEAEDDDDVDDDDTDDDDAADELQQQRRRPNHASSINTTTTNNNNNNNNNSNNNNKRWLELELTDFEADDVGYIWVIVHTQRASAAPTTAADTAAGRALPHAAHAFRIENTCGACRTPFELDLSAFRCLRSSKGTTGDLITMLSGTFAPCANRIQVDFRGVRSIAAMRQDWEMITSIRARDETSISIYMLVMKACIGIPALIVDHGATPPGLEGVGAAIAAEGRRKCYLAERMAAFCSNYTQHIDVCQAIELVGIKWAALLGGEDAVAAPLRLDGVRSSVHVSRRGGVMLRLIFPRGTAWDEASEAAVVCACNRLLAVLRKALMGQVM